MMSFVSRHQVAIFAVSVVVAFLAATAFGIVQTSADRSKRPAEIAKTMEAFGCTLAGRLNTYRSTEGMEGAHSTWRCGELLVDYTSAEAINRQRAKGESQHWDKLHAKGQK